LTNAEKLDNLGFTEKRLWFNRILWGVPTSGRWTGSFWLDRAVFVHLPEVKKAVDPLKSKRAKVISPQRHGGHGENSSSSQRNSSPNLAFFFLRALCASVVKVFSV